jgi:hypothetical protein
MREPKYREGPEALENFKRGMEALFKAPKSAVLAKKKQARKPATLRNPTKSGKNQFLERFFLPRPARHRINIRSHDQLAGHRLDHLHDPVARIVLLQGMSVAQFST